MSTRQIRIREQLAIDLLEAANIAADALQDRVDDGDDDAAEAYHRVAAAARKLDAVIAFYDLPREDAS